ncbi:hypothetical protein Pelo_1585 [Pelomyxa schiedti]|nr:hypothetical protein Pelo_1585 [Pelomyxa schiedti]
MNTLKIAESTVSILKQVPVIGAKKERSQKYSKQSSYLQQKIYKNYLVPLRVVYDVEAPVEPICSHYYLTTNKERDGHQL